MKKSTLSLVLLVFLFFFSLFAVKLRETKTVDIMGANIDYGSPIVHRNRIVNYSPMSFDMGSIIFKSITSTLRYSSVGYSSPSSGSVNYSSAASATSIAILGADQSVKSGSGSISYSSGNGSSGVGITRSRESSSATTFASPSMMAVTIDAYVPFQNSSDLSDGGTLTRLPGDDNLTDPPVNVPVGSTLLLLLMLLPYILYKCR